MGAQSQYDFGNRADLDALSAVSLMALNPRPGGNKSPFCEQPMVTSTPHSSWRKSIDPSDEIVSTSSKAGWPVRSIALRTSRTRVVTPVEVSLCTTHTALILCSRSLLSSVSTTCGSTPRRQSSCATCTSRPSFEATCPHKAEKWPMSNISTLSPADRVFTRDASHAPVPDDGKITT